MIDKCGLDRYGKLKPKWENIERIPEQLETDMEEIIELLLETLSQQVRSMQPNVDYRIYVIE